MKKLMKSVFSSRKGGRTERQDSELSGKVILLSTSFYIAQLRFLYHQLFICRHSVAFSFSPDQNGELPRYPSTHPNTDRAQHPEQMRVEIECADSRMHHRGCWHFHIDRIASLRDRESILIHIRVDSMEIKQPSWHCPSVKWRTLKNQ